MGTWEDLIALGRKLAGTGYTVGENPQFGGVDPGVHAPKSAHYTARGDALDINFDGPNETARLQEIVPMAKALGLRLIWQTAGHFGHLHVDTRPGPDIGNIGYTGPALPGNPASKVGLDVPDWVPFLPDEIEGPNLAAFGAALTKPLLIGVGITAGAGLILLGLSKAT